MNKFIITIVALLCVGTTVNAQKRKAKVKPADRKVIVENELGQQMFEDMLPYTEKLLIADSVVVDKSRMAEAMNLPRHLGEVTTFDAFFDSKAGKGGMVYCNEFGDRCYLSLPDTAGVMRLYSADKIGNEWTKPKRITDFGPDFTDISYPYMSDDGVTLYFAAKGKNSIGGYDIFRTSLNAEDGTYVAPENMGLPFNSSADDYYCITSDIDSLTWLVTARHQPAGKVCIYMMVPNKTRLNYTNDNLDNEKLASLARIARMKDTWDFFKNKQLLTDARRRIDALKARSTGKAGGEAMAFVINDDVTYTNESQFRAAGNREQYARLVDMQKDCEVKEKALEEMRNIYAKSDKQSRSRMSKTILASEHEVEQLQLQIHALEKEIRNKENHALE